MGTKITKIGVTNDKISGRGGLAIFLRYIAKTHLYSLISNIFLAKVKVHSKGLQLEQFLKQIFAYFIDGTDMTMTGFDARKNDRGYAPFWKTKWPFLTR